MDGRRSRSSSSPWTFVAAMLLAGACSTSGPAVDDAVTTSTTIATSTSTSSTTTTTTSTSTTTTTTTTPEPPVLRRGAEGPEVEAVQRRLHDLGYWIGEVDGRYGSQTAQAVMAFQKVEGFHPDGLVGPLTSVALAIADRPVAGHPDRDGLEIDLTRQVLFVVRDGVVAETHNTSTGRRGWRTPPGTFTITRQIDGMRNAPLGQLWRPKYFNGGIAIHGSTSIPGYPASHGCARLSNAAIDHFWGDGIAPIGTTVTVY